MITFSIIQRSQLEGAHRLDAEYYCGDSLLKSDFVFGGDAVSFVQYGTSEELNEEGKGYPVLRLNEFEEWFAGEPAKHCDKLSQSAFNDLKLKKDDVLICRTNGNPKLVGKAALVTQDRDVAFASYLFRVRPDESKINAPSLVAFLNSKIGRAEIEKFLMPSIQSNFSPAQFRQTKIPILPRDLQVDIQSLLSNSAKSLTDSKSLYSQAESLLLEELHLSSEALAKEEDLYSIVNLSDIKSAHRMDAEYFQPKYSRLTSALQARGAKPGIMKDIPARFIPKQDDIYKYVELADINASIGMIDGFSEVLGKEAPSRAKRVLKSGDVVVSSIEGSLDKVALVEEEQGGYLASTGFFQFRNEEILPEVLLVLAKSIVFQMQLEKMCTGTILTAVPKESVNNVLVPILPKETQQKISDLVKKSHEARKKSKELLEEAKRKVEEMIEGE